ncbi:Hypothetical protein LUCI_4466 [Lucifera butyrica]|uniref:Uncharacterized protein n=1 Tax=Lucifera butyrica TaxID=1351585 RepID=A0A498RED2_9FIRM|nr:hypothetical protein [Lucifera butyrica]VBB09180.1 Hypothetical protein LUCI_4466 [Lucifera butyrica]
MNYNINDFLNEINIVIYEVEEELLDRQKGVPGEGSIKQLESIKSELEKIRNQAQNNVLPPKDKRYTAFSRCVVDEWNFNSVLGAKLCDLAEKYKSKI